MESNSRICRIRVALAQINSTVGDIEGNTRSIISWIARARDCGAELVVFPELAVTGYPPEDLLLKSSFVNDNVLAVQEIAAATAGITAIVGFVDANKDIYNSAAVLHNGSVAGITHKMFLPNYGVFDEDRYFQAGLGTQVYSRSGIRFGVEICEDLWYADGPHSSQAIAGGAHLIVDINSSPFCAGKWIARERMLATRAADNTCAIIYLNAVGGQDELVFDGHSMLIGANGETLLRMKSFELQFAVVDVDLSLIEHQRLIDPRRRKANRLFDGPRPAEIVLDTLPTPKAAGESTQSCSPPSELEEIYAALVTGTRDYVEKNGFKSVVLGLSGGIDSAIVACIAADALGPERVRVLVMPSEFSSNETQSDAEALALNLGVRCDRIAIDDVFGEFKSTLAGLFSETQPDVTEENLQARIRGNLLMAVSNKFGSLVLTTGNKSEMACGYSTLYGDMAGGFAVIKDVPKTKVYQLAEYRNGISHVIPETIITRPPTAELRPNQTDQDTLPPYDLLDGILAAYVEEDRSIAQITALGYDEATVRRVVRMVDINEYKRRQAAPGVKITARAFGRDRRLPITNRYRE